MHPFRILLCLTMLAASCRARQDARANPQADRRTVVRAEDAALSLVVDPRGLEFSREEIETWVQQSMDAVATYYARFPVERVTIEVESVAGADVVSGKAIRRPMPWIQILIGSETPEDAIRDDWVLVHELVHLAMPSLPEDQLWFEEGVASYVEPIARVQCGTKSADEVMIEWVRGMPQGQPDPGDEGLDRTHTWGRTYWGGALFCLLADVRIRERTSNRSGLQDALRAVMTDLGDNRQACSFEDVMRAGDAAVGVPVLRELYGQHSRQARRVDLRELWRRLGIRVHGDRVELDDSAPLASVRRAIFAPPTESAGRVAVARDRR